MEDSCYYGKLELKNNDLVTYQSDTLTDLFISFKEAVEDYIQTNKQLKRL